MPFAAIWIDPEMIKLRERQIAYDIIYRCNLKMDTRERITKQKQTHSLRKQTQELRKEKESGEG